MPTKVAIVTDTTSDLPAELAEQRKITLTSLHIQWGWESLLDRVDIKSDAFYKRLVSSNLLPKTSQPSSGEFADKFRQARDAEDAGAVLCITISNTLSGTYASAVAAQHMVDFPVKVVDSHTASLALGFTVLAAADARDNGANLRDAAEAAEAASRRAQMLFTLETLEYLHRGGRIGGAQRFIGTALNIKPLLWVKDGAVAPLESVRTKNKALARMIEQAARFATTRPLKIGVLHAYSNEVDSFVEQVKAKLQPDELIVAPATPVIGVHVGPGVIGLAVLPG